MQNIYEKIKSFFSKIFKQNNVKRLNEKNINIKENNFKNLEKTNEKKEIFNKQITVANISQNGTNTIEKERIMNLYNNAKDGKIEFDEIETKDLKKIWALFCEEAKICDKKLQSEIIELEKILIQNS